MPYMERLCHIGAAIIQHNFLCLFWHLQPEFLILNHAVQIFLQKNRADFQIQKSRRHCIHFFEYPAAFQRFRHLLCDHNGRFLIALRPGHRPIALVFAQIRTIGCGHLAQFPIIPCCPECFFHFFRYNFENLFHSLPHFCTALLCKTSLWMPCGHKLEIENFNFQSCSF